MSVSIQPETKPNGQYKQIFNINDWKRKKAGYVTFADLEDYANLYAGNTFVGAMNVFQSIGFLNNINNIPSTTFNYLKNVSADIQTQIDDIYVYTIEQLLLKRDLTNLDFNSINDISRQQLTYLSTITGDVQAQIDTKRNLIDNVFYGDVQMKNTDGTYGCIFKPSWNNSTSKVDNASITLTGYTNVYIPSTIYPSYIQSASGGVLGSSTHLTRIRKNLNVDNCVRIGYNDATNVTGLSNNSNLDVKGSVNITQYLYLGGMNLKTYIDAQDDAIRTELETLPTSTDITNLETEITDLQTQITTLDTNKATISYVDTAVANVYNTSADILQTIQDIQTELANDDATEVVLFNQIATKVNITDYNADKTAMTSTINSNTTSINNNITTINNKIANYVNETDTNTTKINSDLSINDKLIVNGINCNEIIVNKITVKDIVTPTQESKTMLVYLYFNNRVYPIMKKKGLFSELATIQSNFTYEGTVLPKTEFSIYDGNNRIISKIRNETDDIVYYQPLTIPTGIMPHSFVLKNI